MSMKIRYYISPYGGPEIDLSPLTNWKSGQWLFYAFSGNGINPIKGRKRKSRKK